MFHISLQQIFTQAAVKKLFLKTLLKCMLFFNNRSVYSCQCEKSLDGKYTLRHSLEAFALSKKKNITSKPETKKKTMTFKLATI